MTFQPLIPISGVVGWKLLQNTFDRQFDTFSKSFEIQRNVDYFLENAAAVEDSSELVSDIRLLTVAAGAFSLSSEINKKALLRKIIDDGTESNEAIANKFNDDRFRQFSDAIGFGNVTGNRLLRSDVRQDIADRYQRLAFEEAVGGVDDNMRLALNFKRAIAEIANTGYEGDSTGWLKAMGQQPVRAVLDTAFGLPAEFVKADIDKQVETYQQKAQQVFGSKNVDVFQDPEVVDAAIRRFLALSEAKAGPTALTRGAGAVQLLAGSGGNGLGASAQIGLILSNAR